MYSSMTLAKRTLDAIIEKMRRKYRIIKWYLDSRVFEADPEHHFQVECWSERGGADDPAKISFNLAHAQGKEEIENNWFSDGDSWYLDEMTPDEIFDAMIREIED